MRSLAVILGALALAPGCGASAPPRAAAPTATAAPRPPEALPRPASPEPAEGLMPQCIRLIGVVNEERRSVVVIHDDNPVDLRELGQDLRGLAAAMEGVALSDARLVELRGDYVAMADELGGLAGEAAAAIERADRAAARPAIAALRALPDREGTITHAINAHCGDDP